ncbi:DUF5686 family protein [Porphyromonas sp.]|uniref:DUF5686 family protein n=1 Tax=Porphyromonas sp. TaxID=1924944 RepID=UPI0026DB8C8F|nr:DUF5686 family protein [Porphyromonas sp.]MDO4770889.1 DUF5686 family protein [Porphyromonas sp.]
MYYRWLRYMMALVVSMIATPFVTVAQKRADVKGPHVTHVVRVTDAVSGRPVYGVDVMASAPLSRKYMTGFSGVCKVKYPRAFYSSGRSISLSFSHAAYHPLLYTYVPREVENDTLRIEIMPVGGIAEDVVVERPRGVYNAKDNPAVILMDSLINIRLRGYDEHTYRVYDKLNLSVANFDLNNRLLNSLFPFFRNYVTTSKLNGKWVLPLSLRESVSDVGYNGSDGEIREIIRYRNRIGVDQNIDDGTMTQSLEEIFPRVDIFRDDIKLLDNRFVSPLSTVAKRFYKFYLTDTIVSKGRVVRVVDYYPYNPRTFCFRGQMYVTVDSGVPRVVRCEMQVPKSINLNFVSDLKITQEFKEIEGGRWVVDEEEMNINLSLFRRTLALYAEHTRKYDHYDFVTPDTLLTRSRVPVRNLSNAPEARRYKLELSSQPLLASDDGAKGFLEEVRRIPFYRFVIDGSEMLSRGYVRTAYSPYKFYGGSKFDIGPVSTFYGKNDIEGVRLRLGGRTTAYLSPRLFLSGYAAYGFRDKQWKYNAQATYSFRNKRYFLDEFPKHDISLTHEYDLYAPGQFYNDNDKDNILRNLGTAYLTSRSYRKTWLMKYRHDGLQGLSYELSGRHTTDRPTGSLSYVYIKKDSTFLNLPEIKDMAFGLKLRYAPGERVYEGNLKTGSRRQEQRDLPIFMLSHEVSVKLWGGDFFFNKTEAGIEQRLWFSSYGNLDYKFKVGKIWNSVPFPLLYTPPVNSATAYNENAFQLMQPMEYIGDEYATFFASYHMRGWLISRIPLLNRLNLRGVFTVNALYGNTSQLNNSKTSRELFVLPVSTSEMENTMYVEVGFGFENILRILRVDVFKRLTPAGPHSGSEYGIKGELRLNF